MSQGTAAPDFTNEQDWEAWIESQLEYIVTLKGPVTEYATPKARQLGHVAAQFMGGQCEGVIDAEFARAGYSRVFAVALLSDERIAAAAKNPS
jgi:hypothetical protein